MTNLLTKKDFVRVYNYDDCPTIRRFSLSNKRIRMIQGPFGSGKSSGMVAEVVRRGHEQAPCKSDGIRRIRVAVVRNCFDDKTEVLTETRGWQLFKDLCPEDKVASLVNNKELVFVSPLNYYQYEYNGEMIGYSNRNIDFLVTPEHNLYISRIDGRTKKMFGYELRKASDIYGKTNYKFKKNTDEYNGGYSELSEKMFEFFGFWFAEGYVGKYPRKDTIGFHWRFTVTQKENANYVKNLLNDCGFKYSQNKGGGSAYNYSIHINDDIKLLIEKLLPCGKATTKYLPGWIKNAPKNHLKSFLRGFEEGDGHTRLHKNDSTRLYTSSERLANDLQELVLRIGGSASLNKNKTNPTKKSFKNNGVTYVLTIHQPRHYNPSTQHGGGWYKEEYSGMVYCVEVPSHVIVTRRNKIISLSSQSYRQLEDSTIKTTHYWLPPSKYGQWNKTEHNYYITKFPGLEIELNFRALDRPDQVDNLLSVEYTFAWFNEYREIPWAVFEAMDGRVDRFPSKEECGCTWAGIIGDTNPPDEYSPYYKFFEGPYPNIVAKVPPQNAQLWKQPSGLSPNAENIRNLAKNYYQNLARNKSDSFVNVYVHGKYGYIEEGKPVYAKSYNDNIHVSTNPLNVIKGIPLVTGWDFGLNPSVVIGQILPTGILNILRSLSSDGVALERFCLETVIPMLRTDFFGMKLLGYGDPAGNARVQTNEKTCYDIFKQNNIGFYELEPATTNDLVPRITAAEKQLGRMIGGQPGVILDPSCTLLRKALAAGYRYKKTASSFGEMFADKPEKNYFSHIANAFEYLCMFVNDSASRMEKEEDFKRQISGYSDSHVGSVIAGY